MTQDETSTCARFVRVLSVLALPVATFTSACGAHAPTDLFSSTTLGASGASMLASGGGSALGSAGALSGTLGGTGGSSDQQQTAGGGAGGSPAMPTGGGASTGGAAGMDAGGSPSDQGGSGNGGMPAGGAVSTAGSSNGGTGGVTSPPSACDPRVVKPPALVSDFEQGVAGWFGYVDGNTASVVSISPGAHGTQHAADFSGGSAKISGMYFPMPCRDVSDFDGVTFWGKSNGNSRVRFLAVIPATDPTAGVGDCDSSKQTCSDHPGKPFTFSSEWTQYYAAWKDLKQLGFGAKASFAGVVNALLWINDGPVDHFDFSIDEVSFYEANATTN